MAYNIPSVNVYQQLENSGGVLSATPDLQACIVGPAYNVLSYVAGSSASLISTAAESAVSATGSTTANSNVVTFATVPPFQVGDTVLIPGATSVASTLSASVTAVTTSSITLSAAAGTTLATVLVSKTGAMTDTNQSNSFTLPGQKVGQLVNESSIQVYLNNASVETLSSKFTGFAGSSTLTVSASTGTGTTTSASTQVTAVSNIAQLTVGDTIGIAGAGAAGAELVGRIVSITGSTLTLSAAAAASVTAGVLVKKAISNINASTSTLLAEPGDALHIEYTNAAGNAASLDVTVTEVVNLNGTLETLATSDMLPANFSRSTTAAAITAGNAAVDVASATGIQAGDTVLISGAGVAGADLVATVGSVSGQTLSGLSPAPATSTTNARVTRRTTATVRVRKAFNNQFLPLNKPSGGTNFVTSSAGTTGVVTINPRPELVYGTVVKADVHFAYKALRLDLSGSVGTVESPDDLVGVLGTPTDENPLALGVQVALANTTTQVRFIAIESDDVQGYLGALELAEGERVYVLVPLTQDEAVLTSFKSHAEQMSLPTEAMWRTTIVNTAIPTKQIVGQYSDEFVNANSGNNTITLINGKYVLTASNAAFVSEGVIPGDVINVTAGTGTPSPIGTMKVLTVINNQQVAVAAQGLATAVSYYVTRILNKTQQAAIVAAKSKAFGSKRVVHVQSDLVGIEINSVTKYLPGYYLACALAGMTAGNPVQQGFTNMALAGISDLKNSNFYFSRAQMGVMAEAGTLLVVQDTVGGIPYVRHELTTDVSVLEYREYLCVKNWDFLSMYFRDRLTPFIGKYNITPDTLNTIRQVINASAGLLIGQKLPQIGAPLLSATIQELSQNPLNKDRVNIRLKISIVYPMNYVDLYLVI